MKFRPWVKEDARSHGRLKKSMGTDQLRAHVAHNVPVTCGGPQIGVG